MSRIPKLVRLSNLGLLSGCFELKIFTTKIDKFAIMLKDVPSNSGVKTKNSAGEPKCIGITGTNRWSPQGMETGYCLNRDYWGKGYATEAFGLFLKYFWTFPRE